MPEKPKQRRYFVDANNGIGLIEAPRNMVIAVIGPHVLR